MKVYVIEDYDNGVTKAFESMEKAQVYMMKEYVSRIVPDFYKNSNLGIDNPEKLIANDMDDVFKGYIEDFMYIHSLEVE